MGGGGVFEIRGGGRGLNPSMNYDNCVMKQGHVHECHAHNQIFLDVLLFTALLFTITMFVIMVAAIYIFLRFLVTNLAKSQTSKF